MDYLIACLKKEGIYIYLDMLTYRKFKEGDNVPQHELLGDKARPWCITSRVLIDLQKEFCDQIWNHVNPYTGLAYKDEPAIVLTEIVNECDLFVDGHSTKVDYEPADYYINEFRGLFRDWLQEQGIEYDWENCDLYTKDEPMLAFKIYITKKYFREMHDHMRSLGVKIPIAGTNWGKTMDNIKAHEEMDFTDSHHYFYDWRWGNTERICQNRSITSAPYAFPNLAKMKLPGKPFFISEWDMPWPNSYRAEGPIHYAAVGALQGWAGFTIHTYAYSCRLDEMKVLGRELSTPVGGIPYREGIFSTWNDPAKFGLFYHSALMLRRCDITPAEKKVAVSHAPLGSKMGPATENLLEQHRCATVYSTELPEGYDEIVDSTSHYPHPEAGMIRSDNGQMWRDLKKQFGVIDTPRTKVVYGLLGRAANKASTVKTKVMGVTLDGLSVACKTDFGVIALSSLTDEPLDKTDNILMSAIGRARNTDPIFDGEKMLDVGKPPIMAEVIQADIRLKTEHGNSMKVWGINAEGFYSGKILTTYEDGYLCFHIGDEQNPACYYLIVKE